LPGWSIPPSESAKQKRNPEPRSEPPVQPHEAERTRTGYTVKVSKHLLVAILVASSVLAPGALGSETHSSASAGGTQGGKAAQGSPANTAVRRVNPTRAMQYVREVVQIGSRPVGSAGHKKTEAYIRSKLRGDQVEEDVFTADTPGGKFEMRNIIAKYPGTRDGVIVIASHYDTNLPLKNYVGANDGGSSTGLLLELANHFRGKKREGYAVWLLWTDGEEALQKWSATDSLYGSRHLADKWQQDGTLKKIRAFVLLDMIGDADLNVDRDMNSTPWLEDLVGQAAAHLGYQSHFFARVIQIDDDHLPFARMQVPVADLIDFTYGYNNVFHHTSEDTLDKLSPTSLEIVGNTVLETVRLLDAR